MRRRPMMKRNLLKLGMCILVAVAVGPLCLAAEGEHPYAGTKKCRPCHMKEYTAWSGTRMAKSFELLKPGVNADAKTKAKLDPKKDYTKDVTCLACHTTGYGKPGGFVDLATTPDMAGVGCEMCHGAGGTYLEKEHMSLQNKEYKKADLVKAGLVGTLTKEQCANCHNSKSPFFKDFNFEERKTKGTHEKFPLKFKH
jgi:Cytochrome c554 and c-prime